MLFGEQPDGAMPRGSAGEKDVSQGFCFMACMEVSMLVLIGDVEPI